MHKYRHRLAIDAAVALHLADPSVSHFSSRDTLLHRRRRLVSGQHCSSRLECGQPFSEFGDLLVDVPQLGLVLPAC
jgi:hypothetical protein